MVVRTFLTRRMPSRPRVRIARSTAPREAPARPALAAEQSNPLTPSVEAFWCHLDQPGDGVDGPGEVPDLVLDQSICDGAGRDPGRPHPGSVGPCSDHKALLVQDGKDRLGCIAFGAHLVDDRADQRLRGSSSPAKKIEARRRIGGFKRSAQHLL